jgi:hypothetical protein
MYLRKYDRLRRLTIRMRSRLAEPGKHEANL